MTKTQEDNVQIGEQAIVRCVTAMMYSYIDKDTAIVTGIPIWHYPLHEDGEILKFPERHRHFDYRFWTNEMVYEYLYPHLIFFPSTWPTQIALEPGILEEYDLTLTCVREIPFLDKLYDILVDLEKAYENQSLMDGDICPHRRFKVFPDSETGENCKTCPGHGLSFDKRGKVVARSQPE